MTVCLLFFAANLFRREEISACLNFEMKNIITVDRWTFFELATFLTKKTTLYLFVAKLPNKNDSVDRTFCFFVKPL